MHMGSAIQFSSEGGEKRGKSSMPLVFFVGPGTIRQARKGGDIR